MADRHYTVDEIDQMRNFVEHKYLYGSFRTFGDGPYQTSRAYFEAEKIKYVEEQLRTYMLAGLGPNDLVDSVDTSTLEGSTDALPDPTPCKPEKTSVMSPQPPRKSPASRGVA